MYQLASRYKRCVAIRRVLFTVLVAFSIATGQNAPQTPPAAPGAKAKHPLAQPRELKSEEQSCRAFVQRFYDWYWNQFAAKANDLSFDQHKLHWYYDAVKLKPAVLNPELIGLIEKDQATQKASGDIANLDFDPFLNSQDPQGRYEVGRVVVSKDECRATFASHRMSAELRRSGSAWLFVNFRYSYFSDEDEKKAYPDNDLVHILSR